MSTIPRFVCIALLTTGIGCTPSLKDDAPANREYSSGDFPPSFIDQDGQPVELKKYRGKALVMIVVRGMPESPGGVFCPYCLAQASSLAKNYEQFKSVNAEVLLVFPGPSSRAVEFGQQVKAQGEGTLALPYPVCVDQDCSTCSQLGIRGDLAKPSTFIFDAAGDVAYAYVGKSTSDRPSVKAILAELERLKK